MPTDRIAPQIRGRDRPVFSTIGSESIDWIAILVYQAVLIFLAGGLPFLRRHRS